MLASSILGAIGSLALLASPAAAAAVPSTDAAASEAQVQQRESGMDIQDACRRQHGPDYVAIRRGGGCHDWKCQSPQGNEYGLNLNLHCYQLYGVDSYASCSGGVYNWKCKP